MKGFDIDTAILLSDLSIRAYREPEKIKPEELDLELVSYFDIAKTHTQLYIFKNKSTLYIVFRGTESIRDVMYDFMFIKKNFPDNATSFFRPKVHHGFLYTFQSVEKMLFDKIKDLIAENQYKIYVTGHSLGAALAVLCAFELKNKLNINSTMYNFGCPRIGNRSFVKLYNKKVPDSFRIVNNDDSITNLPKLGYKHVKTLIYIYPRGKLIINPSRMRRFFERLDDLYRFFTGDGWIDHLEHNYLENLKEIREKNHK
ncbi:MAG: lipase family protein [Candidatus Heimdallarchaeota archaeon]|nr:lipase family protein [Candidatus Heimdallarchaeota archaeon]